ncbi:MAG: hypothetical protein IRZ20_09370 [Thermoleophilia bacterium]|nr:hypothetical protein [Thermoleophilia bacterium]
MTAAAGTHEPAAEAGAALAPAADAEVERPVQLGLGLRGALALLFVAMAAIGSYNAWTYPAELGYDWIWNHAYAESLIHHGHIPSRSEGGEYYTPPGYYAIGGAALWIGEKLGMAHPAELAQQVNVLFVLATAVLLLVTARLLFPRRPVVWVAAAGFFAFLPVVPKTAAMLHPESLNMLAAAGAAAFATWMILRRRFGRREFALLALLLAFEQLIRSSGLFTLVAVGLSVVAALLTGRVDRRAGLRALAIGVAALVVVVAPWYVRQAVKYHTATPISVVPGFAQTMLHPGDSAISQQGGLVHFFGVPLLELYRSPTRPHFVNKAIPTTYAEIWGDWLGWWAWDPGKPLGNHQLRVLRDQILIGVIPTLLAAGGWAWLLVTALRRRRELLPFALLPVVALAGYLYRSYAAASNDGDLLKASYLLITAPMWALGFGVAFDRVTRGRWARIGLAALLAAFAVLELRFMVWGLRAGRGL